MAKKLLNEKSRSKKPILTINKGICHVMYAYDIGTTIKLNECIKNMDSLGCTTLSSRNRRAPKFFDFNPPPLVLVQKSIVPCVGKHEIFSLVDLTFYDFGAVSISYEIPFSGTLDDLRELSKSLIDNESLLNDSKSRAENLIKVLGDTIENPCLATLVEDYALFQISDFSLTCPMNVFLKEHGQELAQILRDEVDDLSVEETKDALSCKISFGKNDATIIDWNSAIVFDKDADDVRAVLEFANVELLEMRFLDKQLDTSLEKSYQLTTAQSKFWQWISGNGARNLRRISQLQLEGAILFERVSNAPKLLGDQFLARVYRLIAQRFHLNEWNSSILRKLDTIENIYQQNHDVSAGKRLEMLDWIIIFLIMFEIVMSFLK
jgi:hypothetical protein